jgi:hypothetical protein
MANKKRRVKILMPMRPQLVPASLQSINLTKVKADLVKKTNLIMLS